MAKVKTISRKSTNTKALNTNKKAKSFINNTGRSFIATFMGVAVGVPLAVAAMTPVIKAEVTSATSNATHQTIQLAPAAALLQCTQPTKSSNAAAAAIKAGVSSPSSTPANSLFVKPAHINPFVTKEFIGNLAANNTATISDTGPNSTNKIDISNTDTTTITNNNNIDLNNSNSQNSQSGSSTVKDNTTAGSATSGDSSNYNSSDVSLDINN